MGDEAKIKIEGDNAGLKKSLAESSKLLTTFASKHSGLDTPTVESPTKGLGDFAMHSLEVFTGLGALEGVKESLKQLQEVMRESITVAADYEASLAKFDTVYKNAGYQAGYTKDQLAALNEELHRSTGIPTDDIRDSMSELFKIGQIYGDTFKKTLQVSADFAAFNNKTMAESIKAVGRAVQNPAQGMHYFSNEVGQLTQAEMRHIKTLQDSMQIEKARALLLDIVGKKLEGQASARKDTLRGMFMEIEDARHEAFKGIGESMAPGLKALGPILVDFIGAIKELGVVAGGVFSGIAKAIGFIDQAIRELVESIRAWQNLLGGGQKLHQFYVDVVREGERTGRITKGQLPEDRGKGAGGPDAAQGAIEQMPTQKSIEGTFEALESTWKRIAGASAENTTVAAIDNQTKAQQTQAKEQLDATNKTNSWLDMLYYGNILGGSPRPPAGALGHG